MDISNSQAMTWTYSLKGNVDDIKCEQEVVKVNFMKDQEASK
jgi:hypothetical protein